MTCPYFQTCGGCTLRNLSQAAYREHKSERFNHFVAALKQKDIVLGKPFFADDAGRRRVEFSFQFGKKGLSFGFYEAQSHTLTNIDKCLSLTNKINAIIVPLKDFLTRLCQIKASTKIKGKICSLGITQGKISVTDAANGLDIVLHIKETISLEHRMLICDFAQSNAAVIRISVTQNGHSAETVIEKTKPFIENSGYRIYIAAGTFLQATDASQQALIDLVKKYSGNESLKIADLFCGIGTFSYPLAQNIKNKITAIDASVELISGFTQTVNALKLPNIKIKQQNLFKYPLDGRELSQFNLVIFDPPRAGAAAQVKEIALAKEDDKPQKIIAVSCNPYTFINDANELLSGGYKIVEITMVDQFPYTNHFELVALFTKGEKNES